MMKKAILMCLGLTFAIHNVIGQDTTFYRAYGNWVLSYIEVAAGTAPFDRGGRYWILSGIGESADTSEPDSRPLIIISHDVQSGTLQCRIRWHEAFVDTEIRAWFGNGAVIRFAALSGSEIFAGTKSMDLLHESIFYAQFVSADFFVEELLALGDSDRFVLRANTLGPLFGGDFRGLSFGEPSNMPPPEIGATWNTNGFMDAFELYTANTASWLSKSPQRGGR